MGGNCQSSLSTQIDSDDSSSQPKPPSRPLPPLPVRLETSTGRPSVSGYQRDISRDSISCHSSGTIGYDDYEEWRLQFQAKLYQRMKLECYTNMRGFILNNLLLSVPVLQDFDKAQKDSEKLKLDMETRLNAELKEFGKLEDDNENLNAIKVLNGMPLLFCQNYISTLAQSRNSNEESKIFKEKIQRGDYKKKFSNFGEAVLPVEFYVAMGDCQIYTQREWNDLVKGDYAIIGQEVSLKGFHFCLKDHSKDGQIKIPPGYVCLYCVDSQSICKSRPSQGKFKNIQSERNDLHYDLATASSSVNSTVRTLQSRNSYNGLYQRGQNLFEIDEKTPIPIPPQRQCRSRTNSLWTQSDLTSSGYNSQSVGTTSTAMTPLKFKNPWGNRQLNQLWELEDENSNKNFQLDSFPWKATLLPPNCFIDINDLDLDEFPDEPLNPNLNNDHQVNIKSTSKQIQSKLSQDENSTKYLIPHEISKYFTSDCSPILLQIILQHLDFESSKTFNSRSSIDIEMDHHTKSYISTSTSTPTKDTSCSRKSFSGSENDKLNFNFKIPYSLTPCLNSSKWPRKHLLKFVNRFRLPPTIFKTGQFTLQDKVKLATAWPSKYHIDAIESFGCNIIPLDPLDPLDPDETCTSSDMESQSSSEDDVNLTWQVNFFDAESLLLDSFKHSHWRCYIFSSMLIRSFIIPILNQGQSQNSGIDLGHIRNILYQMCAEDFVAWYDEEPGMHVQNLLNRLYDCLGKKKMSNFFIPNQNLFKDNLMINLIQNSLNKIRENLEIYFIFNFQHIKYLQEEQENFNPFSNLKKLYRLITIPKDSQLLYILNPRLKSISMNLSGSSKKSKSDVPIQLLSVRSNLNLLDESQDKGKDKDKDRKQQRTRKEFQKWQTKQQHEEESESRKNLDEKNQFINLEICPLTKWSSMRISMIIQYFIEQFIKISKNCLYKEDYTGATMYTMHIQNLCRLLASLNRTSENLQTVESFQISDYLDEATQMMIQIGSRRIEYVKSKICHLKPQSQFCPL